MGATIKHRSFHMAPNMQRNIQSTLFRQTVLLIRNAHIHARMDGRVTISRQQRTLIFQESNLNFLF